jgi:beta-mannosidase
VSAHGAAIMTGLPAGAVSSTRTVSLTEGWRMASAAPGSLPGPSELLAAALAWEPAVVPGTVAAAIGPAELDEHENYDALDWWYGCAFAAPSEASGRRVRLRFDGLATLAEVWLNGTPVLETSNMFTAHGVDVTDHIAPENDLLIVFRSLDRALEQKRPRPRWKTKLVEHQQLRWLRTTLLGRIPGWTPRIRPVGPWRPVWLETVSGPDLVEVDLRTRVIGDAGSVSIDAKLAPSLPGSSVRSASIHVGSETFDLAVSPSRIHGEVRLADPRLWWPRTHGDPALYACSLALDTPDGPVSVDLGRIGFRDVHVDTSGGDVRMVVNGVPVFCRGACWTTNDIVSLVGPEDWLRSTLELTADANANMVRVGGTMVYESDAFYRICDELGLMVWQDLMFANMDYPVQDAAFRQSIQTEADQQLRRLQRHPCVVTVCGGSEVEQQAAMFGAPRQARSNDFFSEALPALVERTVGVPYWPSTPTGGALPFHVSEGIAHYFGVGAYLRPLEDVRSAGVRFSPECLGFSNMPEASNLHGFGPDPVLALRHPDWKRGVPRDSGTTWDFEDVRDHYLHVLYGVDPAELREGDPARYVSLSRVVTGRVMAAVFDEWRSPQNPCAGGLVWFLKDLRPGAGWGIIDSDNLPKPVYHDLKRAWAPLRIALLDRGLDGVRIEVHNETPEPVGGVLEVVVLNAVSVVTARASREVCIPPRGVAAQSVDDVIGYFIDSTYAYRFGPPQHAAIVASLRADGREDSIREVRRTVFDIGDGLDPATSHSPTGIA